MILSGSLPTPCFVIAFTVSIWDLTPCLFRIVICTHLVHCKAYSKPSVRLFDVRAHADEGAGKDHPVTGGQTLQIAGQNKRIAQSTAKTTYKRRQEEERSEERKDDGR